MPKTAKTEKTEKVEVVKDDNYYQARISRMPQAIENMPTTNKDEMRNQMKVQFAYDEVMGEEQLQDDKERYQAYLHLGHLNKRFELDAIDRVRSADPNKNAWEDLSIAQATQLLNADADFTGFTQMRTNKAGVREPLTSQYLIEYLASNYQRNNKYDKNTNYTTQTPQVEDTVPEVAE
tara:strand:+ start:609 stop:1142 length:534 start_codon:yes stop_codon:yes gene_type:complete